MNLFASVDHFLRLFAATGLLGPQLLDLPLEEGLGPDPNGEPDPPPETASSAQPPPPAGGGGSPLI